MQDNIQIKSRQLLEKEKKWKELLSIAGSPIRIASKSPSAFGSPISSGFFLRAMVPQTNIYTRGLSFVKRNLKNKSVAYKYSKFSPSNNNTQEKKTRRPRYCVLVVARFLWRLLYTCLISGISKTRTKERYGSSDPLRVFESVFNKAQKAFFFIIDQYRLWAHADERSICSCIYRNKRSFAVLIGKQRTWNRTFTERIPNYKNWGLII